MTELLLILLQGIGLAVLAVAALIAAVLVLCRLSEAHHARLAERERLLELLEQIASKHQS